MSNYFVRGSVLALALSVLSVGPVYAQESHTAKSDQPTPPSHQSNMQQPEAKAFTGTIVKDGKNFMLKDTASDVSYKVDDDSKVKDYVGKQVKITGTLDSSSNVIHIDSIEVLS